MRSASVVRGRKAVAREPVTFPPWAAERPMTERDDTGEPQERSRDALGLTPSRERGRGSESPAGFRAEQTVEGVRNAEDGRCWGQRGKPPGIPDARFCRAL